MLGGSRKGTCAGSMKPSGRTEERPQKKIFALVFPHGGPLAAIVMKSKACAGLKL